MVPVKTPPHREVLILGTRIRNIPHKSVDIFLVRFKPGGIKVAENRTGEDVVTVMKVVIIVRRVAKVGPHVTCDVRSRRYHPTPCGCGSQISAEKRSRVGDVRLTLVEEGKLLLVGRKLAERGFKLAQTSVGEALVPDQVVGDIENQREFSKCLCIKLIPRSQQVCTRTTLQSTHLSAEVH